MELLGRFRRAVRKLTFLLSLKTFLASSTWKIAELASKLRTRAPAIAGVHRWRRRAYSFGDRPGLRACVDVVVVANDDLDHYHAYGFLSQDSDYDGEEEDNGRRSGGSSSSSSPYPLRRTTSNPIRSSTENVDNQAEMFIQNFHKHLIYEKQVSLDLRYCRDYTTSSNSDTIVSPFSISSADSQLVSPI